MNQQITQEKSFWQLSKKIPLVIIAAATLSCFALMVYAITEFEKVADENVENNFSAQISGRVVEINDYFEGISSDLRILSTSPLTQKAILAFSRAWKMYDGDAGLELQKKYIEENPNPIGEKHLLDIPEDDMSAYAQVHKAYHPWFRQFLLENGYYDIFLFDTEGNLVYTVFKENDFATNMNTGPWKDTDLARAFVQAVKAEGTQQVFMDFKAYEPSAGAPASFIAEPVMFNGKTIGVLAFQMPVEKINRIVGHQTGLGKSGEVILVGADQLARNQSPVIQENTILRRTVDLEGVGLALKGQSGISQGNFEGALKYIGYAPLSFLNTSYAIIVTEDYAEIFSHVTKLKKFLIIGFVIILGIVTIVGVALGRSISKPISQLTDLIEKLANGDTDKVLMQERRDELGDMARALNKIHILSVENTRIRAALDNASTNIMVADAERKIIYMNPAVQEMMKNAETAIQKAIPHFEADNILGNSIDIYHKLPSHQATVLSTLNGSHKTRLEMGERTFDLTASSVRDNLGNSVGSVVEWNDITDRLAAETREKEIAAENYRIRVALDNANTNVMVADANRNVIFINKALLDMMKHSEHEIQKSISGFKANEMLNGSLDRFHHRPDHQIDILQNLTTDYPFKLKLGEHSFECVANPIIDEENNRLGSVIEWVDVTKELAVKAEVEKIVQAVSSGDFSQSISLEGKEGFMLNLAERINELKSNISGVFEDVAQSLSALSQGDLNYQIEKEYAGQFGVIKDDTNKTTNRLKQVFGDIVMASTEIANAAREISSGSIDLSQRTETQAANLEETAASMEEIATTVKQNAQNAQQANTSAIAARSVAEGGGDVVNQAVDAMASIEESTQKVSDIISVIDEIAFQTNLLALNAAVEAARAGEAGKGFAVVASEVRTLAQRSSEAAKDIKGLILDSNEQVKQGVNLVGETGEALDNIVSSIKKVTDIVSEIAAASQEQSTGVDQVNVAVTHMDEMTQQNAALVEESSASARSLEDQADRMLKLVSFFNLGQSALDDYSPVIPSDTIPEKRENKVLSYKSMPSQSDDVDSDWEEF